MRRLGAAVASISILVAAACGGGAVESDGTRTLTVFGPYRGAEADAFAASMRSFEEQSGIDVRYVGSANFVVDLRTTVATGVDEPDVAIVPQPGLVEEFIASGSLVALDEERIDVLIENYDSNVLALDGGSSSDPSYVVPYRQTVKSIVWFRPEVFAERGWEVPETLDQLVELADRIEAEPGIAPWCFSISSGTATGWPATDWVEDLVLRLGGPDVYDEWVSGDRLFDDPVVRDAFEMFQSLVLGAGRHAGDTRTILQTDVQDTDEPMFGPEPGCGMFKQANFALSWMPDGTSIEPGGDVDFFVLPGIESGAAPLVVGGDNAVAFNDSDETFELMAYLATPESGAEWARRGGYVSARNSVDVDTYYTAADRRFVELFLDDRTIRFDGSDSMAPDVGSSLWWSEITSWIGGATSLDDMVSALDDARLTD